MTNEKPNKDKKTWVIHPFVVAPFPVFTVYIINADSVSPRVILLPLTLILCATFIVWRLSLRLFKTREKAGIVSFLLAFSFISFQSICYYAKKLGFGISSMNLADQVLVTEILAIGLCLYLIKRTRWELRFPNVFLNILVCFVFAMIMPPFFTSLLAAAQSDARTGEPVATAISGEVTEKPDIYYIILDGYGRADVLEEFYGVDNSEFLAYLRSNGFYVADKSTSNYSQTYLSLASSLNLTYLDSVLTDQARQTGSRRVLRDNIRRNKVVDFLRGQGYAFVSFATGITNTEIRSADRYLVPGFALSEYQQVLLNVTAIPTLLRKLHWKKNWQYDAHRERILYIIEKLPLVDDVDSPKFVFAHIVSPHPPFVLGENGEHIAPDRAFAFGDGATFMKNGRGAEYEENYGKQLRYITKRIQDALGRLLAHSPDAIIILQADHGPGPVHNGEGPEDTNYRERLAILNALHGPPGLAEKLYENISPVNTFRLVFNHVFGTDYELLEDVARFSTWEEPYEFTDVTDAVNGPSQTP